MTKVSIQLEVPIQFLFGVDSINVNYDNQNVSVNLYDAIIRSLAYDLREDPGTVYDYFHSAIDEVYSPADADKDEEKFEAFLKRLNLLIINNDMLKIVDCYADPYDCFYVTFDLDLTKFYQDFCEKYKKG